MRRFRTEIAVCIALSALTLGAMGAACWNGFVNYDDKDYVTNNSQVKAGLSRAGFAWAFTTTDAANWHPLTWLSLQLDATLFGSDSAFGFHLTNLLLHTANVLLLFLALRRLTGAVWRSALVAALFAVHPTHVESVAWVAERKDVLSGLFAMLTLLAYAWYAERPGWGRYALVLIAFALGLMAKPMLVTLPCVLLLLDYWPLGRTDGETRSLSRKRLGWLLLEKVPLFALTAAACLVTMHAQQGAMSSFENLPLHERLMNAASAYAGYLGKLIWPSKLAALYPHPHDRLLLEQAARAIVILLAISGLVLWARRRRYLTVGWLWFLGTLVPVIGLIQVGSQAMADRYTYLPYIGLFIALSWGVADLTRRWPAAIPAVVAPAAVLLGLWGLLGFWWYRHDGTSMMEDGRLNQLVIALTAFALVAWGVGWLMGLWPRRVSLLVPALAFILGLWTALTAWQVRVWHNSIWLWENTLRATEDATGEPNGLAHNQMGDAYFNSTNSRRIELAREHFLKCLASIPNHAKAHNNLGLVELDAGNLDDAAKHLEDARKLDSSLLVVWGNLGVVQERQGHYEEAIATFQEALRRDPLQPGVWDHLGRSLAALRRWPEAEAALRRAVELEPRRTDYRADLAWTLRHLDRQSEAAEQYAGVTALDADWAEKARKTAWTWATDPRGARRNRFEAVRWAEQACQAHGSCDVHFLETLAAAYAEDGRFDEAVKWQKKAAKLAPEAEKKTIEQRGTLYEQKKPYREPKA